MEVHAHAHAHGKKTWRSYFWEFMMLFLAVFCGFLAENFREHVVEKHRAKDYARALIRDLKTDTANINKWSGYYSYFIASMDSMISLSANNQINPGTSGKFAWYCRNALWHVPLPWQRTSFDQLKSSGNIRYFKDYKLQEMIANYNTTIEGIMQAFILENPTSDNARDMTNKVLDTKTYYEYSKTTLITASNSPRSYLDSLTNRVVSFTNKEELIEELVNMVVYRRRSYLVELNGMPEIKSMATDLIEELEKAYHLK